MTDPRFFRKYLDILAEVEVGAATVGPGGSINVPTHASSTSDQRPKENEPGPTRVDMPKDARGWPIEPGLEPSPFGPEDLVPGLGPLARSKRVGQAVSTISDMTGKAGRSVSDLAGRAGWSAKGVAYNNFPPYKSYLDRKFSGGEVGKIPGAARLNYDPHDDMPINRAEALLKKQAYLDSAKPGDDSVQNFIRWQWELIKKHPEFDKEVNQMARAAKSNDLTSRPAINNDPDATKISRRPK